MFNVYFLLFSTKYFQLNISLIITKIHIKISPLKPWTNVEFLFSNFNTHLSISSLKKWLLLVKIEIFSMVKVSKKLSRQNIMKFVML
jgi:hypothetical protein